MKIVINHDNCGHADAYSDRCLRNSILNPEGHERYCMKEVIEDGKEELTVVLIQDGKQYTLVLHEPGEIEATAEEGWVAFERGEIIKLDSIS